MKKNDRNIASTVADIVGPVISGLDYDLWDVEYVKEGADYYLRITIDREEGITIDDCETVHRAIDPLLDEADPIEGAYHLEVSSPGIERELKYDWHYEQFIGATVEAKLFAPLNGRKSVCGSLVSHTPDELVILEGDAEVRLPCDKVAKVRTVFNFDDAYDN